MLSESQEYTTVIVPERLLVTLHDAGVQLSASEDVVLFRWGLHLLEDWKSLSLLAQAQTVN